MHRKVLALFIAIPAALCFGADKISNQQFIHMIAQQNLGELKISELAVKHAQDPKVREFALHNVQQSKALQTFLAGKAKAHGIKLPKTPSQGDQAALQHLSSLSGKKFDLAYMNEQVEAYKKASAAFTKEGKAGATVEARRLARKAMPTLIAGTERAHKIQWRLAGENYAARSSGGAKSGGKKKSGGK